MTTVAAQLRFLAAVTNVNDRDLANLTRAVAGRNDATLDDLTAEQVQRLAIQLNRRMACDPVVLDRADRGDPGDPPDYRPTED
jgi:adenine-specific DNA methylase